MTVGLIVNPKSGKDSGHGLKLAKMLAGDENVDVKIIEKFEALPAMMDDFAARQISILYISSGDGTVQAIQSDIVERKKFGKQPMLCLLPHGTTNLTASDLGYKDKSVAKQAEFVRATGVGAKPEEVESRFTLRVANPADGVVRHGMYMGTGAIWQGTKFCQTDVHKTGLKGSSAVFATLATALFKAAFFPNNPDDLSRIDRSYDMTITADGKQVAEGGQVVFQLTTLNQLILGIKPFWGGATKPIRTTLISYPPPNVFCWTLPIMRGSEDRKLPDSCQSFCADEILIETDCPFAIDGEFFDPPANEPLRVELGQEFSYVRG